MPPSYVTIYVLNNRGNNGWVELEVEVRARVQTLRKETAQGVLLKVSARARVNRGVLRYKRVSNPVV